MPAAYSYLRFSSPQQANGDSIRRQTQAREDWLAANPAVTLDKSLKMTDAGRSGFKRKDWDAYALAQFVAHVKSGRVEPGSYLLVENLDRLSRESAGEATELFLSIVNRGITVVQLSPAVLEFRKPVDMMSLMFAIVELSRGHSESATKSDRVGKAWARKQAEAGRKVLTKRLPGWIDHEDGKLVLNAEKAEVVRRIFRLAVDGHGGMTIAKRLNAEGVPPLGRTTMKGRPVGWANVTVNHILASRATVGEYVPYKTNRDKPSGDPVAGYYPAVVDQQTFYAAQAAMKARGRVGRGRRGNHVNLFAGLLVDALDGGPMTYRHQKPAPHIVPTNAHQGRGRWATFPAGPFERAVLSRLREVRASDVADDNAAARDAKALSGEAEEVRGLIRAWQAKMDDVAIVDTVAAKLAELHGRLKSVTERLAAAQRDAASPLSEALGGLHTLADLLDADDSPDLRSKVRAALRRCLESVYCVFGGTNARRWAAVRIQFADGGGHRDYLISLAYDLRGDRKQPPRVDVLTFAEAGQDVGLDLRDPAAAREVAAALSRMLPQR